MSISDNKAQKPKQYENQDWDPIFRRRKKTDAELQEEAWMQDEYYDQWSDEDERR